MITLYHLKNAVAQLKVKDYTKPVLSSILLDLYNTDNKNMGRRCKVNIVGFNEDVVNEDYKVLAKSSIDNYTRTIYFRNRYTTICEYKQKEKK